MAIEIKEVSNTIDLKQFIQFPMRMYKENPYYVPPLISEEIAALSHDKNELYREGKAKSKYFLAYKNGEIVGRIAAMINYQEVKEQGIPRARFGWFDFIDDKEVSQKLLEKAIEFGRAEGLKEIEGPVGLTNLDRAGLLTKGFDKVATMVTLYNHPYYEEHLLAHGFETAKEWVEYELYMPETLPEKLNKFTDLIQKRYKIKVRDLKSKQDLLQIVDPMFELLDKTYGHLSSYVPITKKQIQHYKDKYINFVIPDFVTVIEDEAGRMIAFAITMPSYSKALQKANGKLFPFGWYHFWKASKKNDAAAFYLIGIDPEYQGKGVTAIIFSEMYKTFKKYGISYLETNPELAENKSIQTLWKDYDPVNHKRRKSYRKDI
ncbi:GTP cyclohydrolase [Ornithobacterium rhinotracheale]|uniref:GTP cyclohydrolase n=1 Tax=Ornithobacterium rhinotracheale TaxID=28251 RepID=UPI003873CC88